MIFAKNRRINLFIITSLSFMITISLSVGLGMALAENNNTRNSENFGQQKQALPSHILDAKGRLVTELFSDEKRDLVTLNELPKNLVFALITREDKSFFQHNGFSIKGTSRALWNILKDDYVSGGSTLTQQLAGKLYADRNDQSVKRKLIELWWAWQMERQFTKQEIIEKYMNKMPFGHNAYGVEAASRFFFNHSARENDPAESVMLVIQLAKPFLYSPYRNLARSRNMHSTVMNHMVENNFLTEEEKNLYINTYWQNFDWSKDNKSTVFFDRKDKAKWFSEHVRTQLDDMLYGSRSVYKDGYRIHTTLNLDYQKEADIVVGEKLSEIRESHKTQDEARREDVYQSYTPLISLLALSQNIPQLRIEEEQKNKRAIDYFKREISPDLKLLALIAGNSEMSSISKLSYTEEKDKSRNEIETALITIDNSTGKILALIGGSDFRTDNQINRALSGELMPGSAFKPLYYSAAISTRDFTASTRFHDGPKIYYDDGKPYTPNNYAGKWYGPVLLREALNDSLNIPALEILSQIGFDAAIDRSADLLGIEDPAYIRRNFPRKIPLGLGISRVSPKQMVRAFATFGNGGRAVDPYSIRYITDRNGNVIENLEAEKIEALKDEKFQIMNAQDAYIMTNIMETTLTHGTLRTGNRLVNGFDGMAMAGKTGTTDNWEDAWAVGYSPYMTTAVWFGFDTGNKSLGANNHGAGLSGRVWAKYMKAVHSELEPRQFPRPDGIIEREICSVSGKLALNAYCHTKIKEVYIKGTEPGTFCDIHKFKEEHDQDMIQKISQILSYNHFDLNMGFDKLDNSSDYDYIFAGNEYDPRDDYEEEKTESVEGILD